MLHRCGLGIKYESMTAAEAWRYRLPSSSDSVLPSILLVAFIHFAPSFTLRLHFLSFKIELKRSAERRRSCNQSFIVQWQATIPRPTS